MTLEELVTCDHAEKMESVCEAVEQLLVAAQRQGCLTVGVYESAKLMDVVVLCLLAVDEEEEGEDVALQIHFTLIQAFCCANDIHILRVSGMERLAALLGGGDAAPNATPAPNAPAANTTTTTEPRDLHCLLVTTPHTDCWKSHGLDRVARYCEESRGNNQWVPYVALQAR